MFNVRIAALSIAAIAALVAPVVAAAHPKVVAATPAANGTASGVTRIVLTFSERLTPKLSGATLVMTGMPGMANHPDMKMASAKAAVGADGKSIELVSTKPLPAGSYRVDWHVVGADTHRVTGTHAFSVSR